MKQTIEEKREYGRAYYHKKKSLKNKTPIKDIDHNLVIDLYCNQGLSTYQIGIQLNIDKTNIRRILLQNKITLRSISDALDRIKGPNNKYWQGYGEISGNYWSGIRKCASKRNLEFTLTIEEAWELFLKQNRKCRFSKIELTFPIKFKDKNQGNYTASLDRIDSDKGYTKDNVQWVHKLINIMKQDMKDEEFIEWCKLITKENI